MTPRNGQCNCGEDNNDGSAASNRTRTEEAADKECCKENQKWNSAIKHEGVSVYFDSAFVLSMRERRLTHQLSGLREPRRGVPRSQNARLPQARCSAFG
jgi:hypothetical protein